MNNLSGFNSQEMRRLHPYLSALLGRLKELEMKVARGGEVLWGTDEDIQPTANANIGGILNKFARADHQHLFKFPTAIPLSTPDGSAFFDISASAINIYVDDTPTTRVVAGGTEGDVQPTGRRNTGTAPRYAYADHSHPTALLPQTDPQPPVEGEIRVSADDKLVRWDGSEWIEVSVEEVEAGVDADVRPTKRLSAGSVPRFARADHSHPTAILPQGDTQTPEVDEIRYTTDDKLVRWNGTAWVPLSVETFTVEWGDDVQPTRLRSVGSSTRFARADHSHPTAILPQGNTQTPVADEIRFNADDKLVRWNGSAWVPLSVETFDFEVEWGADDDVQPTKLKEAGASTRFARADHSHPTALLPEDDPQTPVANEIRFNTDDKVVRWDSTDEVWVPLSVEGFEFEVEWGIDDDVEPTKLRSAGTATRFARADHSHPTAILPQGDTQTPVVDEIRYNTSDKIVRWDGTAWVPLSVETGGAEAGTDDDVQPTKLKSTGTSTRYARADHSHPTAILPQSNTQTPVADEIRFNADDKLVRWDESEETWVPLSVETFEFEAEWATNSDVQPTRLQSTGTSTRFARADHSHPTAILPQSDTQTPATDEIRYNDGNKLVRWDGDNWVPLSVETFTIDWGTNNDVQPTGTAGAGVADRVARADHSHPTALLPEDDTQTPVANEIRFNADDKIVRWDGSEWVPLSVETFDFEVEWGTNGDVQPTKLREAGASTRFARADHSHPTAILPQGNAQTPVADEIRFNDENKIVRWDGNGWVPLSVETFTIDWGTDTDVQPTRQRSAGSSTRVARADHSHPTALLPQSDTQTPVADEIRYTDADKLVRWDGDGWVPLSVETFEIEWATNADVQPTKLRSTGSSTRVARADHSHPTAILPQSDSQTPVVDEIRYNTDGKLVRWDGDDWVSLSVETFTVEWATNADVQPTKLRSTGSSARFARADHSHPTAILPQSNAQTPETDEIRYNDDNKLVRWDGDDWVELSVETVEAGLDSDIQPTKLRDAGSSSRFARADHSHPTAILPQGNAQTPVADEIRYNTDNKIVRWDGSAWVPLSVETFEVEWGADDDVQPTKLRSAGTSTQFARADHSHPTAILPQDDAQTPEEDEIRYNDDNKLVRWDGSDWVELSVETVEAGVLSDVQPTKLRSTGASARFARADHSHPTAILPQSNSQTPVADEIRYDTDDKLVRWDGNDWVPLSVETFTIDWGTNSDVQATGLRSEGTTTRVARADHSHPTALLPQDDTQTPVVNEIRFNTDDKVVRWDGSDWVPLSVETGGGEAGTDSDVQPTKLKSAGTSTRYARADHSHPTAILPQSNSQTPVADEIRYNTNNKLVRWDGSAWVPLSVETFDIEWGTDNDIDATGLRKAGTSTRFARADHSHPTAILHQNDIQSPFIDEIAYTPDNKLVRWDGEEWVELSVETTPAGTIGDVQKTGLRSTGSVPRFSRADHSHPTALLPMTHSQTAVVDELRYKGANRLVRWTGSTWTDIISPLPVPADPLVLPLTDDVDSPLNRQLVNHSSWDGIGDATIFYRDNNNNQYRLVFARPLVIATSSTPSEKNVWVSKANELVLKYQAGDPNGATGVLWSRGGNTTIWSPVATQLLDSDTNLIPTDVGVLARSPLTGTSGSRRWFLRGATEDGSFRAPLIGIATYTSSTLPATTSFSTTLEDGYAYFIQDFDRVDIVKQITNGSRHPVILTHHIIAPPCRIFSTATDPSGHYIVDELWNGVWAISFYTTTSATSNLVAVLPSIAIPYGIRGTRTLLYLHNPQTSTITTAFQVSFRIPTASGITNYASAITSIDIPASTTVVADLGFFSFLPSSELSHHRSQLIAPVIIRRKASEPTNANKVICLGVALVPQRAS